MSNNGIKLISVLCKQFYLGKMWGAEASQPPVAPCTSCPRVLKEGQNKIFVKPFSNEAFIVEVRNKLLIHFDSEYSF